MASPSERTPLMQQSGSAHSLRPILKILVGSLLWASAAYSSKAATLDGIRRFACAAYYARHALPAAALLGGGGSARHACDAAAVEASAARSILLADTLSGSITLLAVLFFAQRLKTWGRRPVLMLGASAVFCVQLPFLVLPLGPTAAPDQAPDSAWISPLNAMRVIVAMYVAQGLLGAETLTMVTVRTMLADHSSAAERTRNLTWGSLSYLAGIVLGPLLAGVASAIWPTSSTSLVHFAHLLPGWPHHREPVPPNGSPIPPPLPPGPPDSTSIEFNITPFIVSLVTGSLAMLWIIFFVAESKPKRYEDEDGQEEQVPTSSFSLAPLRLLLPAPTPGGTHDWRLTRLAVVQFFGTSGGTGLTVLILSCGHVYGWSTSSVGYMLAWIAGSRVLVLSLIVPLLVLLLERLVRRPTPLHGMPKEELERLAREAKVDEAPGGVSEFAQMEDAHVDLHADNVLRPLVVLWRSSIDIALARVSYVFELTGYIIIAVSASIPSGVLMLFGSLFLSLGGGYPPAMQSAAIAIASDVFAAPAVRGSEQQGSADQVLAAFSLIDTTVQVLVPIATTSLYAATNARFPSAAFILIAVFYGTAVVLLSGLSPHRSSTTHMHSA